MQMIIINPMKIRGVLPLTGSASPAGGDFVEFVEQPSKMDIVCPGNEGML
jgi:hypothetical protein